MPPVIVGVAAAIGTYLVTQVAVTAIAIGLAAAALYAVATMKIPKAPGTSPTEAKKMIRSPNQPFRTVYGRAMVSGPIVFAEEYFHESGYEESYEVCGWRGHKDDKEYVCRTEKRWVDTSKKWLHLVVPLCSHPSNGVEEVYFNDKLQEEWDHDYWRINVLDGTQQSQADLPDLLKQVPSWTSTMLGKGITWVHVALRHSTTHFPNGIPNIKCLVKGKSVSTPFYSGFTNNAAAVLYDYLLTHFKAKPKEVNVESFQNDYAICGEVMNDEVPPPADPNDVGAVTNPPIRYAIDGAFDWDEPHDNIMKKMLSACGGKLMFTNGQYHLQVAAYRGPVPTAQVISLSDLNGPVTILPDVTRSERVNKVTGQHLDPERFYQQVDFTPVTDQTYIDEDGEELTTDLNLEYVLNKHQAHRLANIVLKDNRYGITLDVPMNLRGFKYNVGLPVRFDEQQLGYDQLEFMVVSWKITEKNGLSLKLKQTSPEIFDDSIVVVPPKPPSTQLPDPAYCAPAYQLSFVQLDDDGTYDGLLIWAHPDINNVNNFQVVATSSGGEVFRFNTGKDLELRLQNMRGVTYTIAVIAYNLNGSPSEPATITAKIGAPKDITGVDFELDNFEITIRPKVAGDLPINTTFDFFKADTEIPDVNQITLLGTGTSYTDVGLEPARTYHYFVQVVNNSAKSEVFGPFSATTTNIPDKIFDLIKDEIPGQYTWICYASDAFGSNISATFNPAIHIFEGRAYNKPTEQQSLLPADYQFRRIGDFITPEEQDVLDNLSQGKLPDGSGDLISADDVLFKPGDLVQGSQIANGAISAPNLAINAVTVDKIAAGAVTVDKVAVGAVTAPKLAVNSVTVDKVAAGAITNEKVAVSAIEAPNLAQYAVVEDKIAANAVVASKISAGAIETDKLAANAVTAAKIAADTITANQIAASAITSSELAANSVTAGKIAANAVTANTIAAGSITADKIAANTITASQIASDTITANQIAAGAITASELAANSVIAGKIAANAVTANTIAALSITADKIAANTITSSQIAADTITANQIAASAVTASELAANSVVAGKIAANAVTANTIAAGSITADKIEANAIGTDKIVANAITSAKISTGAITADKLAANAVIAGKVAANAITANNIQAGAITADKIAVTVVSPINNISESGNANGWYLEQNTTLINQISVGGAVVPTLRILTSTSSVFPPSYTEPFSVDSNSVYEVKLSVYSQSQTTAGFRLWASAKNSTGASDTVDRYHAVTLDLNNSTTSPMFYSGTISGWRHITCYIVGSNVDLTAVPKTINATYLLKLRDSARKVSIGFNAGFSSGVIDTIHVYSPSVTKVGSGKIIADEIRANTSMSAPVINGGVINGGEINGATGNFEGNVKAGNLVGVVSAQKKLTISQVTVDKYSPTEVIGSFSIKADTLKDQAVFVKLPTIEVMFIQPNLTNNNTYYVWDNLGTIRGVANGVAVPSDLRYNTGPLLEVKVELVIRGSVVVDPSPVVYNFNYYKSVINTNLQNPQANNKYNYFIYRSLESDSLVGPAYCYKSADENYVDEVDIQITIRMSNLSAIPTPPGGIEDIIVSVNPASAQVSSIFVDDGHITQI